MNKLAKKRMKQTLEAEARFNDLLKLSPFSKRLIKSKRRDAGLVDWRQYISCELYKEGYSLPVIGDVMNRDHTSIHHLIKKRKKAIDIANPVD